jgi:hypothetical protein
MSKIGVIVGREWSWPRAFIAAWAQRDQHLLDWRARFAEDGGISGKA